MAFKNARTTVFSKSDGAGITFRSGSEILKKNSTGLPQPGSDTPLKVRGGGMFNVFLALDSIGILVMCKALKRECIQRVAIHSLCNVKNKSGQGNDLMDCTLANGSC